MESRVGLNRASSRTQRQEGDGEGMNDGSILTLCGAAASIGVLHTVLGPDHYVPFVAMSRAGRWSLAQTLTVAVLCGIGHVLGSVVLGLIGIAVGVGVFELEHIERWRGDVAGWLLVAFGLVYFAWGVRRALRNRPHTHLHVHADGTLHAHEHVHQTEHLHVHAAGARSREVSGRVTPRGGGDRMAAVDHDRHSGTGAQEAVGIAVSGAGRPESMTPWILFTIFIFGPCEPLIPMLMYPAATGSRWGVVVVASVFGVTTVATMTVLVTLGYLGCGAWSWPKLQRYSHAAGGLVVVACGAAVMAGL